MMNIMRRILMRWWYPLLVPSILALLVLLPEGQPLALPTIQKHSLPHLPVERMEQQPRSSLVGDWAGARASLRRRDCCVVTVPGLESQLRILQDVLADNGPSDIDLRARIRVHSSSSACCYSDCVQVRNSVVPLDWEKTIVSSSSRENTTIGNLDNSSSLSNLIIDPCSAALEELARGVASFAVVGPRKQYDDVKKESRRIVEDVFVRIVCASDYRGKDPPYHTDKAPLRGYVTLRGVGTEFMTRPCSPMEYLTLRTLGEGGPTKSIRQAKELEFIVMKGDYYDTSTVTTPSKTRDDIDDNDEQNSSSPSSSSSSWISKIWNRATACVHRSPPGRGGRRVIISFDLADGDDDREWYQVGLKREWRSGMTQRKSHLVA